MELNYWPVKFAISTPAWIKHDLIVIVDWRAGEICTSLWCGVQRAITSSGKTKSGIATLTSYNKKAAFVSMV